MKELNIDTLRQMAHSPLHNYAIPGLTSWLIGQPGAQGCVRLFECSRDHVEPITPHSHRFDFQAMVLRGQVTNRRWMIGFPGDQCQRTQLFYDGAPGDYTVVPGDTHSYFYVDSVFKEGDVYSMKAPDIHSIYFKRGTVVLMFEGPSYSDSSDILEPVVDGERIPLFEVQPWMFKRDPITK